MSGGPKGSFNLNWDYSFKGEEMHAKQIFRALAVAVVGALVATTAVVAPASSAPRTLVRIGEGNLRTSLNSQHADHNLVENGTVTYLTGDGFNYYNNKAELVWKTGFGKVELLSKSPLKVRTTVNPGIVWSDGTAIDAYDLLLPWVTASGNFEDAASKTTWMDVAAGSGMEKIVKFPEISADRRSVIWTFKTFDSGWELFFGIGKPVHALTQLAYPKDSNEEAKARFFKAVKAKDWTVLSKLSDKWNNAYNFVDTVKIDSSTNPKLLVTAGAYMIKSSNPSKSMTLVANPRYRSGPIPAIKTIQLVTIPDPTAMGQALANGEVDIITPQATPALVASLKKQKNTTVFGYGAATFEHFDIFTDGPAFAGMTDAKKLDLRKAILLTIPREELVTKLVKPINPAAKVLDSVSVYLNSSPYHAKMAAVNGVKPYKESETKRLAAAKALLEKHGYSTTNPFKIYLHWGGVTNERRIATAALMVAAAAKVGITIDSKPSATWSQELAGKKSQDAQFYAWSQTSTLFNANLAIYGNDKGAARAQNFINWINPTVEKAIQKHLNKSLSAEEAYQTNVTFEKEYFKDAVGLPLFQWASVAAANKNLKNVKPGPLSPEVVWNYWEWTY
jgi:peptide/nickel transport system substrate-binding protein